MYAENLYENTISEHISLSLKKHKQRGKADSTFVSRLLTRILNTNGIVSRTLLLCLSRDRRIKLGLRKRKRIV